MKQTQLSDLMIICLTLRNVSDYMRSLPFLAVLACLSTSVSAQVPPKPSSDSATSRADVANAEKLALRFPGNPEMTGEYRIGMDNTISVPILGRIPVGGMSPAQLEEALAKLMEPITGRANSVTVEVAAYRPVFVTGFVSRPGAVPWMPGMTVLQALALSGGLFRPTGPTAVGPMAGEAEMAKFRRAMEDRKRALATLARLEAERDGATEIQVPPALVAIAGQAGAQELIAAQKPLFTSRQTSLANQQASLRRGMELAAMELDSLREQSKRVSEQLRMRRESRQRLSELQEKGIVVAARTFEEEIKVSELEEKTAGTAVATARVQATIAGMQRDQVILTEERKASINAEIDRAKREAALLAEEAAAARQAYNLITDASVKGEQGDRTEVSYSLVRNEGKGETTEKVGQASLLKPGDVLVISQEMKLSE